MSAKFRRGLWACGRRRVLRPCVVAADFAVRLTCGDSLTVRRGAADRAAAHAAASLRPGAAAADFAVPGGGGLVVSGEFGRLADLAAL